MVTRVAMKGTTLVLVIRNALITPTSNPTPAETTTPRIRVAVGLVPFVVRFRIANAATTPEIATVDPTDRSMPPEIMTKVSPIAMRTMGAQSEMMFPNTALEKKM
jgi:hypothetical protein